MRAKLTILGLCLLIAVLLMPIVFAAVNVTGNVNNKPPNITSTQLCDGTCAGTKAIDPGTEFTVRIVVNDPNGNTDLNLNRFHLEFFQPGDSNGDAADWDHITLTDMNSASANGCTQAANVYCLTVYDANWTSKFVASSVTGDASVYVRAYDIHGAYGSAQSNGVLTVNDFVGTSQDQTDVSYTGDPGDVNVVMSPTNIVTTHEGNVDLNVNVEASNLVKGGDTIDGNKMHWDLDSNPVGSAFFTGPGTPDEVQADLARGTDPTSNTFSLYTWLDIPLGTPSGAYTGTFTFTVEAS